LRSTSCAEKRRNGPLRCGGRRLAPLEQISSQRAQWRQLPADQRQLRLHQAVAVPLLFRQLFQLGGQRFLLFTVHCHAAALLQARGNRFERSGYALAGVVEQTVAQFLGQAFTVCAQRRQVAEQGVSLHQEVKTQLGILAKVPRLQQHVRQRGGERRIGVMGVASRQAI